MVHVMSLASLKGLIAFPSYHATLAVVTCLAVRGIRRVFAPLCIVTVIILVSATVDGGHYLADVLGGTVVAFIATGAVVALRRWQSRTRTPTPATISPLAASSVEG
jgi:membrane-associated phospholipid phosphatase